MNIRLPALLFDPSLSKPKDEEQEREQEEQFQVKNCPDPECGKPLGEGDHEFCTEEGWLPPVKSTLLPPIPPAPRCKSRKQFFADGAAYPANWSTLTSHEKRQMIAEHKRPQ